jgi:hypothetical protein
MVADKRKPRDKPPPYQRQPKKPKVNDTPATSAQPAAHTAARQNLTLNDWLTVFAYIDAHPAISQCDIDSTVPLDVLKQIRLFRAYLRREELLHGTQTTIDSYFR